MSVAWPAELWDERADVYVPNPAAGGQYTTLAKAGLLCHTQHVSVAPAQTAQARSELAARRRMEWVPEYAMPNDCRVVIDGVTWRPDSDTYARLKGPGVAVIFRRCDLARVEGD